MCPSDICAADFVFEASSPLVRDLSGHHFSFREGNYEFEEGRVLLSLAKTSALNFETLVEPDQALKEKARVDLQPGEEAKLRRCGRHISRPRDTKTCRFFRVRGQR